MVLVSQLLKVIVRPSKVMGFTESSQKV